MTRLRLAWILPVAQVALAQTAWQLSLHPHPRVKGDIYWRSTLDLFCAGLNTPADYVNFVLNELSGWRGGGLLGDLIYITLVAILWYFIGKKIDSYRFSGVSRQERTSIGGILTNLLSVLYGLYFLLVICLHNVIFTNPKNGNMGSSNFVGDIISQTLWLLWCLALILIPSITLVSALHRRSAKHVSASV